MKKFLVIVFIGLLFSNIGYGKISNAYYEELYDACMIEATKGNLGYSMAKDYCKCGADHFDNNYNDKSLIALVEDESEAAYNDVLSFIIAKCKRKVGLE